MKDRIVLAIDNSLGLLCLALGEEEKLLEARIIRGKRASEVIAQEALDMLRHHGLSFRELGVLIFTTGPGSYTGLRVVAAFIKGIRAARRVTLLGLSTFDFLVSPLSFLSGYYLCPMIDAKMGEVFFAIYYAEPEGVRTVVEPKCTKVAELVKHLKGPSILFGNAVPVYASQLRGLNEVAFLLEGEYYPSPSLLLREGLRRGKETEDPRPFYGRRSEAEIKFGLELT